MHVNIESHQIDTNQIILENRINRMLQDWKIDCDRDTIKFLKESTLLINEDKNIYMACSFCKICYLSYILFDNLSENSFTIVFKTNPGDKNEDIQFMKNKSIDYRRWTPKSKKKDFIDLNNLVYEQKIKFLLVTSGIFVQDCFLITLKQLKYDINLKLVIDDADLLTGKRNKSLMYALKDIFITLKRLKRTFSVILYGREESITDKTKNSSEHLIRLLGLNFDNFSIISKGKADNEKSNLKVIKEIETHISAESKDVHSLIENEFRNNYVKKPSFLQDDDCVIIENVANKPMNLPEIQSGKRILINEKEIIEESISEENKKKRLLIENKSRDNYIKEPSLQQNDDCVIVEEQIIVPKTQPLKRKVKEQESDCLIVGEKICIVYTTKKFRKNESGSVKQAVKKIIKEYKDELKLQKPPKITLESVLEQIKEKNINYPGCEFEVFVRRLILCALGLL